MQEKGRRGGKREILIKLITYNMHVVQYNVLEREQVGDGEIYKEHSKVGED